MFRRIEVEGEIRVGRDGQYDRRKSGTRGIPEICTLRKKTLQEGRETNNRVSGQESSPQGRDDKVGRSRDIEVPTTINVNRKV